MSEVWAILGLDQSTATEREVKSAYAKLLKQHRPDKDPEGFNKARAAFEKAIAILRGEVIAEEAKPEPAPLPCEKPQSHPILRPFSAEMPRPPHEDKRHPSSEPEIPKLDPAPQAELPTLIALRETISTRARQKIREAWKAFEQEAISDGQSEWQRLEQILRAFAKQSVLLGDVVSDEQLIAAIKLGDSALAKTVALEWANRGDMRRLGEFFVSFNRARLTALDGEGAIAISYLAKAMGAWVPDNANRLAQKAYPFLPPSRRKELIDAIDHEVMLGNAVERLPHDQKVFWLSCMRGENPRCNWRDQSSRQLLNTLLQTYGTQWPGFAILNQRMPKDVWEEMVKTIKAM